MARIGPAIQVSNFLVMPEVRLSRTVRDCFKTSNEVLRKTPDRREGAFRGDMEGRAKGGGHDGALSYRLRTKTVPAE